MSQTAALKKQKEKEDLENATLERIGGEIRPLISKAFEVCGKEFISSLRKTLRVQVMEEMSALLKKEVHKSVKELSSSLGAELKNSVREEFMDRLPELLQRGMGLAAGTAGSVESLADLASANDGPRAMIRSNLALKRNFNTRVQKRRSLYGGQVPGFGESSAYPEGRGGNARQSIVGRPKTGVRALSLFPVEKPLPTLNEEAVTATAAAPEQAMVTGTSSGTPVNDIAKGYGSRGEDVVKYQPLMDTSGSVNESRDSSIDTAMYKAGENPEEEGPQETRLQAFIASSAFQHTMSFAVVLNALMVGVRTDSRARRVGEEPNPIFMYCDLISLFVFVMEIALRITAEGWGFFFDKASMGSNIFDLTIVLVQIAEEAMKDFSSSSMPNNLTALRLVRIIRVLRIIRLVRLIRLMRVFIELRMIVSLLADTFRSLVGTVVIMLMVLYLLGVCVTESVILKREELLDIGEPVSTNQDWLADQFGSLDRTMLSLFQCTTGGLEWGAMVSALATVNMWMTPLICGYVAFFAFALANVVTGIFVKQSMDAAAEAADDAMIIQINTLFNRQDGLGDITFGEYSSMIDNPEMIQLFKAINIDRSEAPLLFRLMDDNGDGIVDYEEFINGALRLRGPAKSLELAMYVKEANVNSRWVSGQLASIEKEVSKFSSFSTEALRQLSQLEDEVCRIALETRMKQPVLFKGNTVDGDRMSEVQSMRSNSEISAAIGDL